MVTQAQAQESHETPVEQAVDTMQAQTESVEHHEAAPGAADAHGAEAGHAEVAHYDVFPPFDFAQYPNQLLWLALCFAALYLLMSKLALPQIGSTIDKRKALIDADLAAADASRQKTDAAIAAYEEALATARRNAQKLAEETKSTIQADLAAKRKDVEADLAKKVADAEARIATTKSAALGHVDEIAAETAQALVATLFKPATDAEARDAVAKVSKE